MSTPLPVDKAAKVLLSRATFFREVAELASKHGMHISRVELRPVHMMDAVIGGGATFGCTLDFNVFSEPPALKEMYPLYPTKNDDQEKLDRR